MVTRREFLKTSVAAGAGLFVPLEFTPRTAFAQCTPPVSPTLTQFVNQLPIPGAAPIDKTSRSLWKLSLSMDNHMHVFHDMAAELGPVATFGFGGATYLGPTIIAQQGTPLQATFANNLGVHPLSPWISTTNGVMGIQASDATAPRVSTHLHGAYVEVASDGEPEDFFASGVSKVFNYTNDQQAATLWYHDHALGITRLNVYAGLAAYYLLRDRYDTGDPARNPIRNLPVGYGKYEIPLVIQDKSFVNNGDGTSSLVYTSNPPIWVPEFFGDVAVVNGKVWPNLDVEPAVYRFRILNGSEARFYNLSLNNGGLIYQIGTDSGMLDAPVPLPELLIAPGERADVLIDFTGCSGTLIVLGNDAAAPYPGGGEVMLPEIMQFTVGPSAGPGAVLTIPTFLRGRDHTADRITQLSRFQNKIVKRRVVMLFEVTLPDGTPVLDTLNILHLDESLSGVNGISGENAVSANTLEEWDIVNMTGDVHPIHLHLAQFQLFNRQNFNTMRYMNALDALPTRNILATNNVMSVPDLVNNPIPDPNALGFLNGPAFSPEPNEMGWKDTIQARPNQITRILVPFGNQALGGRGSSAIPFGAAHVGNPFTGTYVWHCHILDHEENEMMNYFTVE